MCEHIENQNLLNVSLFNKFIYKEECTLCFHNSTLENGINLCLQCFNGSCEKNIEKNKIDHTVLHKNKKNHNIYLNIKKKITQVEQPKSEIKKLALNTEGGILDLQITTYDYKLNCLLCQKKYDIPENLNNLVKSIEEHESAYKKQTLDAWELELKICGHSKNISKEKICDKINLEKCNDCDMVGNLWLCIDCGNLGCGRKNYDGTGGNNHGISHYDKTKHPISIKVGTLCGDQNPSCYCYICDDEVNISNAREVVKKFGLDIDNMKKTEKTINEMSLEYNLNFKLSENFERNENLKKIDISTRPHGLENIGNSCYINSVIQNLIALDKINIFSIHSNPIAFTHITNCQKNPSDCFTCQLIKLVSVLKSNEYKGEDLEIRPYMFRYLVGKDHLEFRTQKQQDACEYLIHLFSFIKKAEKELKAEYSSFFDFISVTKFDCPDCECFYERENRTNLLTLKLGENLAKQVVENWDDKVNKPFDIDFETFLLQGIIAEDSVLSCKNCQKKNVFVGKTYIKKFPKYLMFKIDNFTIHQFQAIKMHFKFLFNPEKIDLTTLDIQSQKLDPTKKLKFEKKEEEFNQEALQNLSSMGFSLNRCKAALIESGHNIENALNILLTNVNNANYGQPTKKKVSSNKTFPQVWEMVGSMGLNKNYIEKVCKHFSNKGAEYCINYIFDNPNDNGTLMDLEEEVQNEEVEIVDNGKREYRVSGGVVHLGKSVHVGHYVGFARRDGKWVYFNDNKVYESEVPKVGQSYVLFLEKME